MRLPILAVALAATATAGIASAPADDDFLPFWAKFRDAALSGNMTALAVATRFPLQAGFDDEQDAVRTISRAQFAPYLRTELRCASNDTGSNLDALRRRTRLDPKYDYHSGTRAVVGEFEFTKAGGTWKLSTINYGSIAQYKNRLRGRCD